jgi:hypothetical protein
MYHIEEQQQLLAKDIEWMTDTWKNLKRIYGHLNRDPGVEAQLEDAIEHRGILYGENEMYDTRLNLGCTTRFSVCFS